MRLFQKSERSSFSYWFAHWCAFNMTALLCRAWKFKYLFHDWSKPWLMLIWKDYDKVQKYHREHSRHHLEYKGRREIDWDAYIIDNESGRYTKEGSPYNAQTWLTINRGSRISEEHYQKAWEALERLILKK